MFGADKGQGNDLDGKGLVIGIVQSRFNQGITDTIVAACKAELETLGVATKNIDHVSVPGALEIPVALQAMAEKGGYDGLIATGCVIRGETYHFELGANESAAGVTRVGLDYQLPVANVILTTDNVAQAMARHEEKGRDGARVIVEMCRLLDRL